MPVITDTSEINQGKPIYDKDWLFQSVSMCENGSEHSASDVRSQTPALEPAQEDRPEKHVAYAGYQKVFIPGTQEIRKTLISRDRQNYPPQYFNTGEIRSQWKRCENFFEDGRIPEHAVIQQHEQNWYRLSQRSPFVFVLLGLGSLHERPDEAELHGAEAGVLRYFTCKKIIEAICKPIQERNQNIPPEATILIDKSFLTREDEEFIVSFFTAMDIVATVDFKYIGAIIAMDWEALHGHRSKLFITFRSDNPVRSLIADIVEEHPKQLPTAIICSDPSVGNLSRNPDYCGDDTTTRVVKWLNEYDAVPFDLRRPDIYGQHLKLFLPRGM